MAGSIPLPPDLYPHILEHVTSRSLLATLAQVDRVFLELTRYHLYTKVWVRPWERGSEDKFHLLFRTLASDDRLARIVRSLDIRFYPLHHGNLSEEVCVAALKRMTSLETLTWTRDTTLTTDLLRTITSLPSLSSLEINGHSTGSFDAALLPELANSSARPNNPDTLSSGGSGFGRRKGWGRRRRGLRELKLILPDRAVIDALLPLLKALDEKGGDEAGLTGFEIISQDARFINCDMLVALSPYLSRLKTFKLLGCGHVGPKGIFSVLKSAQANLEDVSLEGVNLPGDDEYLLDALLSFERESQLSRGICLSRLRSLTGDTTCQHRLILPDYSRQRAKRNRQASAMRSFAETEGMGDDGGMFNADRDQHHHEASWFDYSQYPQLDDESFLPPTLESLHISDRVDPDERGHSALEKIQAASRIWPNLKKLWFTGNWCDEESLRILVDEKHGLRRLESLSIKIEGMDTDGLAKYISRLPDLRVLHLVTQDRMKSFADFSQEKLEQLASAAGPCLEQIGFFNRVYHVRRRLINRPDTGRRVLRGWSHTPLEGGDTDSKFDLGGLKLAVDPASDARLRPEITEEEHVFLEVWNNPNAIPEIFQVWRA